MMEPRPFALSARGREAMAKASRWKARLLAYVSLAVPLSVIWALSAHTTCTPGSKASVMALPEAVAAAVTT